MQTTTPSEHIVQVRLAIHGPTLWEPCKLRRIHKLRICTCRAVRKHMSLLVWPFIGSVGFDLVSVITAMFAGPCPVI